MNLIGSRTSSKRALASNYITCNWNLTFDLEFVLCI